MEIFEEDYLLDASPHEDKEPFQPSPETSEDEVDGN